jgi:hypothetical protein
MFDFRGTWKSSYLFSDIVVFVAQNKDKVHGVVEVHKFFGGKDLYHFEGVVQGSAVAAWHHNGRRFEGKATGKDQAAGILTTRSGARLGLKAKRVSQKTPKM